MAREMEGEPSEWFSLPFQRFGVRVRRDDIEAIQLTEDADWFGIARWCGGDVREPADGSRRLSLGGRLGSFTAILNDWVIRHADGSSEALSEADLAARYEPVPVDDDGRERTYEAGRADGLLEFAQALSEMADMAMPHGAVRGALVKVAELARERAEPAADGPAGAVATSDSPEAQNRPEGREGCGADLCLPDFAGGSIVLRCDIPPAEHPGLNHHDPAYGAWWQPCDLPDHGHRES